MQKSLNLLHVRQIECIACRKNWKKSMFAKQFFIFIDNFQRGQSKKFKNALCS